MLERSSRLPARLHAVPAEWAGIGLALFSALSSATVGIWAKMGAAAGLSISSMLSWRFGLLTLLLAALGYAKISRQQLWPLVALGLLHVTTTLAYFTALSHISAGTAALLVYCAPAVVILLGLLAHIRPSRWQVLALFSTLSGLLVVVGTPGPADAHLGGLLMGALAGALYGGYFFASYRLSRGVKPLTVTAVVSAVTAVVAALLGAAQGDLTTPHGWPQWGAVLGLALLPSLLAMPTLYAAVARIGATRTSMLTTTDPVWAVVLACLLLGETLSAGQVLGGALILAGACLAQRESKPAKRRVRRGKQWSSP